MSYLVKLVPRGEREIRIKAQTDASQNVEIFYDFRSGTINLPKVRLEISLPIYRMENYRTFSDQRENIAKAKKDTSYFQHGQELQSVQQEQHEILVKLARKAKSDSSANILDVLAKEGQRESLLVSSTGVVINGNRRLAAMRELIIDNPQIGQQFNHIDCMVLPPDTTPNEILDIEASLQAKPETKLDYDWIGDAQLVSRLVTMRGDTKIVGERLNRTENDIKRTIMALAEADLYLKEWINSEGYYSKVYVDEQLFKDLPKLISEKSQSLQNASRVIAWTLLDNKDRVPGRVYNFNAAIGELAEDVLDRMADDMDVSLTPEESSGEAEGFSIDLSSDDDTLDYSPLINALKAEETKEAAVDSLIDACQSAIETKKGQVSGKAALKAVSQAHAKLVSVDISKAEAASVPTIKKQLTSIAELVARLIAKIEKTQN